MGERSARGFVLQATYRLCGRVPVVHLYGMLEGGGSFLVRDNRQVPHFHIRRTDAAKARRLGANRQFETASRTFDGARALRVEVPTPQDAPPLRDRLEAANVPTFEADVRFATRYLIDRGIRAGCAIAGSWTAGERIARVYDNPHLSPADARVAPSVLSFDIETDPKAERLLAIALHAQTGVDEVYIVDDSGRAMPPAAIACADEAAALDAFSARVRAIDPDVLTGWNVIDFDLNVLRRIARHHRRPLDLGREDGPVRVRPARGYFGSGQALIPGRLVLDGMDLVRGAYVRMGDYSLNGVARSVLGEGKVALGDEGGDRAGAIMARYKDDLPTFAEYARADARLALQVVEALDLVTLAFARSRLTGMTPDRVTASIASFDFLYLAALRRRRVVAPSVRPRGDSVSRRQAGGHILAPVAGIHDNVWVFDFKSLYPSVIRTFNIDPLAFRPPGGDVAASLAENLIVVSGEAAFDRGPAILPRMLERLFPQREAAKTSGDAVASQAIKILMNSFYGVLGAATCRFHNAALANAVTGMGRRLLQWSKAWFEERGYPVLYGDTDSVFVRSGLDTAAARATGPTLAAALNQALADHIRARWKVPSRLEMELEKLYVKLVLPPARHGAAGAAKRYAGLVDGQKNVEFVGMEVVRRDWTELAKDVQREIYARLFADAPVADYLAETANALRAGALDAKLIYRKGLRKAPREYTANTPPHVAAARKSKRKDRVIAYVMTVAGPEPLDALRHEPDREHYLDKQMRPIAAPVLAALGLDFDQVVGDDRQAELF